MAASTDHLMSDNVELDFSSSSTEKESAASSAYTEIDRSLFGKCLKLYNKDLELGTLEDLAEKLNKMKSGPYFYDRNLPKGISESEAFLCLTPFFLVKDNTHFGFYDLSFLYYVIEYKPKFGKDVLKNNEESFEFHLEATNILFKLYMKSFSNPKNKSKSSSKVKCQTYGHVDSLRASYPEIQNMVETELSEQMLNNPDNGFINNSNQRAVSLYTLMKNNIILQDYAKNNFLKGHSEANQNKEANFGLEKKFNSESEMQIDSCNQQKPSSTFIPSFSFQLNTHSNWGGKNILDQNMSSNQPVQSSQESSKMDTEDNGNSNPNINNIDLSKSKFNFFD